MQREEYPFGRFDVSIPDHEVEPGVLRAIKNLIPTGSPEQPAYSPAELPGQVGDLNGILSLGRYVRSRRGSLSVEVAQAESGSVYDDTTEGYAPAPLPSVRYAHATGHTGDNQIIIAGGAEGGGRTATTTLYNTETNTYEEGASLPDTIAGMGSCMLGANMHIAGGNAGTGTLDSHYVYETQADTWRALEPLPAARNNGFMVAGGGFVYYLGGTDDSGTIVDTVYRYDPADDSWDTVAALATATKWHVAYFVEGSPDQIFVVGGNQGSGPVDDVQAWDASADTWTAKTAITTAVQRAAIEEAFGSLFVFGGETGGGLNATIYAYDVAGDTWHDQQETIPDAAEELRAHKIGNWIFIQGGRDGQTPLDAMRAFYPASDPTDPTNTTEDVDLPTAPPATALRRLVALTRDALYVIDPDTGEARRVYTFPNVDDSRKAQFASIGNQLWIAVSSGAGVGGPDQVLTLIDDAVLTLDLPALPLVSGSKLSETDSALQAGTYAYRYAYVLQNGTLGAASRPFIITIGSADEPATLRFEIEAFPETPPAEWLSQVRGVAVFLTASAFALKETPSGDESAIDRVFNAPYYRIATMTTLATGATTRLDWTDAQEAIPTYPLLDDDQLTRHDIKAAAGFSYNKRLLLGDVAYDWRRPQASLNLVDAGNNLGENNPPVVSPPPFDPPTLYPSTTTIVTFYIDDKEGDNVKDITTSVSNLPGVECQIDNEVLQYQNAGVWTAGTPAVGESRSYWRVQLTIVCVSATQEAGSIISVSATDAQDNVGSGGITLDVKPSTNDGLL